MAAHVGSRLSRVTAAGAILLGLLLVPCVARRPSRAADPKEGAVASGAPDDRDNGPSHESEEPPLIDPLSVNAACYVCHMTFVGEELSTVHLQEKTTCIDCHGLSAPHANDENIGATPPDVVFKRDQVDASCEKCHEEHDAPGAEVVARFLERKLAGPRPICTDCHGTHKIEQPEEHDDLDAGADPVAPDEADTGRP
jgi:hypothetical protein